MKPHIYQKSSASTSFTEAQKDLVSKYESNGWRFSSYVPESRLIVMKRSEIDSESNREIILHAHIGPEYGSSRLK